MIHAWALGVYAEFCFRVAAFEERRAAWLRRLAGRAGASAERWTERHHRADGVAGPFDAEAGR